MSPPIDIDGSEIQRATIDGEDVSEITIDGQQTAGFVDIPDSAIGQYDATQLSLSDGDGVSTWPDSTSSGNDLSGGTPTYRENQRNGNATVDFGVTDDILDVVYGSSVSQPNTVIVVSTFPDATAFSTLFDGDGNERHSSFIDTNGALKYTAGSGVTADASPDMAWGLRSFVFDSPNSLVRLNGSDLTTGDDVGSNPLGGFQLNANVNDDHPSGAEVGEAMVYDANLSSTGELTDEEQRLADKWGFTL